MRILEYLNRLRQEQVNSITNIMFEDYYNLTVDFGTNNHVTFDQVVNGEIDYVHPSVLYLDTPWNGHKYWMGVNPYPNTVGAFENPYLFYSDDGETWITLSGTPTPIKPLEADTGNNSDAHIYIEDNTMYYFNRGVLTAGGAYIDVFSSTDAINWSSRTRIINSNDVGFSDYVSPSLVKRGSTYYLFGTDPDDQTVLCVLSSTSITGTWTEINRISLGNAGSLWHPEVRWHEDRFILLSSNNFISGGNLMLGQFFDVTDTEIETRNTFLLPRNDQTWNVAYYKSSFIIKNDGTMELYLGCKGDALNSNTDWRVQKVIASKLPQTLDLSDYELVNIYPFADVSNGFIDGMKDLNYNLIALQCTLVNPWDFNIQVARSGTTDFNRFNITGTTTYYRNWGKPPFADEPLLYGIKAGDEITIIKDELTYTIYVNGVASFTTSCDSQLDYNRGTLFGDFLNNGSIQDLKVYMKPEWIFSTEKFDEHITFMNTESSVIPSQYILADNFDRTLLGSQDDLGNTYTIVGSPNIVSDTNFRGSGGFIGINHSETDYSIYVESVDNRTGKIYLNYTDSNNLRYLEFQDFNDKFLKLQTIDSGVTTTTELDILKYHENYSRWQIEIVGDSIIKIYGDNVLLKSATLAANANPKFVGLGGAYATNQYNNFFVRKTAPVYTDVTPPSAPTDLIASNIVDVSMDLSWTASTDDFVVFNYKIFNNDILLHDIGSSNTNYTLTGLTPSTLYNLTVRAYDFAGNESTNSNIEAVTTLAPDTEAPTAPTSLVASNITNETIDLEWVVATDNFGVVDYKIYDNDVLLATVGSNTTSYQLTGLAESTLYSLTVRALDLAGNESVNSNTQEVTTTSPTVNTDLTNANIRFIVGNPAALNNSDNALQALFTANNVGTVQIVSSENAGTVSNHNFTVISTSTGNYDFSALSLEDKPIITINANNYNEFNLGANFEQEGYLNNGEHSIINTHPILTGIPNPFLYTTNGGAWFIGKIGISSNATATAYLVSNYSNNDYQVIAFDEGDTLSNSTLSINKRIYIASPTDGNIWSSNVNTIFVNALKWSHGIAL